MKQNRLFSRLLGMALLCLSFTWAVAQPINDVCSGAINVSCGGTYSGTLVGATKSQGGTLPDVWYRLANASGQVTVSLCNSTPANWDSYLYVRRLDPGQPDCGTTTLIGSDDDGCGTNALSRYTFTASATEVYYILVGDYSNPTPPSNFSLTVTCTPTTPPPGNDLCANATAVTCGSTTAGTTINAGSDLGSNSPGVWYTVQGTGNPIVASTCGGSFPSVFNVLTGTCDAQTLVASSSVPCTNGSTVTFPTVLGTTYYLLINGSGGLAGNFTLTVQCPTPTPTPPSNDYCTGAISMTCGSTINGTTVNATGEYGYTSPGVWYSFVGTGTLATASLCGSGSAFDSQIALYKLSGNNLICTNGMNFITSNDDYCGEDAQVTWFAQLGVTYFILVNGAEATDFGPFKLNLTCSTAAAPTNDLCPNAIDVFCGQDYGGTTETATWDVFTSLGNQTGTYGVWYHLVGTGQEYTISTCTGTSYDSYLWVFYSCPTPLTLPHKSNDDAPDCGKTGFQSRLSFVAALGQDYYILVGGYQMSRGTFNLRVEAVGCADGKTHSTPETADAAPANLAVTAFPNPSQGFVDFNVSVANAGEATIKIMDLAGHEIAVKSLGELEAGKHQFRHDWNGVAAGIYLYQVTVGKQQANGKLQVLR